MNQAFGNSIALSGNTLAVGAHNEASSSAGIDGNQADNSATLAGAVYVFVRGGATWSQQAYVKASNPRTKAYFGEAVAIAGDTLAVGAIGDRSNATGVNGSQADTNTTLAGAAYVFTRSGTTWSQQAYVKASNTTMNAELGNSVSLAGDVLAVAALEDNSNAIGINGNQADTSATQSGAVYLFTRTGGTWAQQAYVKSSNTTLGQFFGYSVALSNDSLAVGALNERSRAKGINGNQNDTSEPSAGAVYVLR
jgi:hypothetical protein